MLATHDFILFITPLSCRCTCASTKPARQQTAIRYQHLSCLFLPAAAAAARLVGPRQHRLLWIELPEVRFDCRFHLPGQRHATARCHDVVPDIFFLVAHNAPDEQLVVRRVGDQAGLQAWSGAVSADENDTK